MRFNALAWSALATAWLAAGPGFADSGVFEARPAAQRVTLTGFTRARARMELSTEVAGRVERVAADVGDIIGQDGIFACLDATFTRLELEANQTEQARMRAEIAYYRKEAARFRNLVEGATAAQAELDGAERNLRVSTQQLRSLQVRERILEEQLKRFCIDAPRGWRVITRHVEPGEWLSVGDPVAELGDYMTLVVPFSLTRAEFRHLHRQMLEDDLTLTLPDEERRVPARLLRTSPAFDPATRKVRVDLALDEVPDGARGGVRAQLTLALADQSGALLVPESAVQRRYGDYWLLRDDGTRVEIIVLGPGPHDGELRIRSPGIRAGDRFRLEP